MSIWKNGKLVAGGSQALPLLTAIWADHILDDISWLRADTFSWHTGNETTGMYPAVYNHLINDLTDGVVAELYGWGNNLYTTSPTPVVGDPVYVSNAYGISGFWFINATVYSYDSQNNTMQAELLNGTLLAFTSRNSANDTENAPVIKTRQSETIAGVTVQFFLADDGHKICPESEMNNVIAIYNAVGVAWYYIIDTVNERFKLPRINPDLEELAYQISAFGDGDYLRFMSSSDSNKGSYINSRTENLGSQTGWLRTYNSGGGLVNLGNMKLSDVKGQSGIKVEKDTIFSGKKHLYFYVGAFTQTALENTAGITAETLNDKVDKGHQVIEFQAPTAENNQYWYRKYADGWVEQGRYVTQYNSATNQITLPITMATGSFTVMVSGTSTTTYANVSTTGFELKTTSGSYCTWTVCGMAA